jgi:PTH1 family peptidyl-tRNA hydrolase
MPSLKLIVGLGNPGTQYRDTRHNVGFHVVDRLSEETRIAVGRKAFRSLAGEGRFEGARLLLLKPQTYMNLSGLAVRDAVAYHRIPLSDLLVIYDDAALELGRIRLRADGSSGGHNGMKSIIEELGSEAFARLRIGVGASKGSSGMIDHVLGRWSHEEAPVIRQSVERAVEAALCCLREGIEAAMNRYNAKTAE